MNETSARVERMRDQQLDRSIRAIAVIGIFALLSSLARSLATGWHPVMALHVALYLLLLVTLGFRRRLRFDFRAAVVVLSCFLLGLAALLSWGFLAFGPVALLCACILATLFFGRRTGTATAFLCLVVLAAVAVGVMAGGLVFDHDPGAFPRSTADWINGMMALALAGGIVIGALGAVSHQMEDLVRSLERQNGTLAENNRRLEQEMEERRRAEEERGRLERSLQTARRMESIGKLAGGVAHDLNNTLGSIVGYPDLLLEDLPADSPMRDILENIRKSGIKAAAIVNDMVTLSRNGVVATDIVSLTAVVGDYCAGPEFRQLRAYHPGVEVDLCLAEDPLYVRGSFFHLSKVIMNLASNAAEAMPDGGRLGILTEKRRVPEAPAADGGPGAREYALLRVADTGIGIAEEDLDRIYEPFYTKKTMGRSGTGLGMSVVWGSVQDHGGTIEVDSVEGKGTVFTVRLPLSEEAPREETPAVAGAGGGRGSGSWSWTTSRSRGRSRPGSWADWATRYARSAAARRPCGTSAALRPTCWFSTCTWSRGSTGWRRCDGSSGSTPGRKRSSPRGMRTPPGSARRATWEPEGVCRSPTCTNRSGWRCARNWTSRRQPGDNGRRRAPASAQEAEAPAGTG